MTRPPAMHDSRNLASLAQENLFLDRTSRCGFLMSLNHNFPQAREGSNSTDSTPKQKPDPNRSGSLVVVSTANAHNIPRPRHTRACRSRPPLKSLGAQLKYKLFASRDILAARLKWLSAEEFALNLATKTACPVPCGTQLFGIALPACRTCCISLPCFYDVECT